MQDLENQDLENLSENVENTDSEVNNQDGGRKRRRRSTKKMRKPLVIINFT